MGDLVATADPLIELSPDIDWEVTVDIDVSNPARPRARVIRRYGPMLGVCVASYVLLSSMLGSAWSQASSMTWENVERNLRESDLNGRRAAARFLAIQKPESQPAQRVVGACKVALADSDAEVRSLAIAALQRVTAFQASKTGIAAPPKIELGQGKELYDLLLASAADVSLEDVPGMGESPGASAITLIGNLFADEPGAEEAITTLYETRSGKPRYEAVQCAVIGLMDRPQFASDKSRRIMLAGLMDANPAVQQAAARVVGKTRPEGGRKALIEAFVLSENQEVRRRLSNALLAYGNDKTELEAIRTAALARAEAAGKLIKFMETRDYRSLD